MSRSIRLSSGIRSGSRDAARPSSRLALRSASSLPLTRKGQAQIFALQGGIVGEARIVERAFGVGPCVLTEAMAWLQDRLASSET